ncbi:MAG: HD domain-containing protein [Pseudomonadota bacterium]
MPKTRRTDPAVTTPDPGAAATLDALAELLAAQGLVAGELEPAQQIAQLVIELTGDPILGRAALLHATFELLPQPPTPAELGPLRLAAGTDALRLAADLGKLGEFGLDERWQQAQSLDAAQAETLRKMLLAVVSDARLVVARLAQQLVRARHARDLDSKQRQRLALETRDLYAPLANRLGIWGVKWELEDLAFRELQPEEYRRIANALNERLVDREHYIVAVCQQIAKELAAANIQARIQGRPKHIYSIYRKMQRKRLPFEQLFDVRAVRVICDSIADCYAALGVVHGLWSFIPGEFDDYIATPKGNNYQSIHTAVHGPDGRSLEIQIRTQQMQDQAELGVAAHWLYKEGAPRNQQYERKIQAVRALLEQQPGTDAEQDVLEKASTGLFDDRVYAMTPKGDVVDLPKGATPLDFAFHVHSDLGTRCRGARINGRIVTLDHAVANGDVVDIIAGKSAAPSRDWLLPDQGYLKSPRSRAKLRAWFRRQDEALHPAPAVTVSAVPAAPADPELAHAPRTRKLIGSGRSPVDIEGVGDLPILLASCCAPVRPQAIVGYLTLSRGVTIHRTGCASFKRMSKARPDRVLNVEWSRGTEDLQSVKVLIEAFDRRGLLRDISDLIAAEHLSIEGVSSETDPQDRIARFVLRLGVHSMGELERLLRKLAAIPNVYKVRRA